MICIYIYYVYNLLEVLSKDGAKEGTIIEVPVGGSCCAKRGFEGEGFLVDALMPLG